MKQNRFTILFTLLVFFLIHVDKTLGCYPVGNTDCSADLGFNDVNIIDAKWLSNAPILSITTYVPDDSSRGKNAAEAYGHFTFGNDKLYYRFLKDPRFVNDHHCNEKGDEKNPYVSYYPYDESQRPAQGTWVGIWLAIYWDCSEINHYDGSVSCCHKNVFNNTYVDYETS